MVLAYHRIPLMTLLLGLVLCATISPLTAQPIRLQDLVGDGRQNSLAVALEADSPATLKIIEQAFALHGGIRSVAPEEAAFIFRFDPAGSRSARITISSGRPPRVLARDILRGQTDTHALLRAADHAVRRTTGRPGFFSGKLAFVSDVSGKREIWESDLLFQRARPLTRHGADCVNPRWSPDGSQVLYTSYFSSGFPDIFKLDLPSGTITTIAAYKGTNSGAVFSPDGRRIAMILSRQGSPEVFIAEPDGRNPQPLTHNRSLEAKPTWSPDGRRLALASDLTGRPQIFTIPVAGGALQRVPTNVSGNCTEPAWNPYSPDQIAFTAAFSGGFQIVVYDFAQGRSVIVSREGGSAVEPAWLADGRHLVFTRRSGARTSLRILDTETGHVADLHNTAIGNTSQADFSEQFPR
ncbi:MAG: biopolymer transporter Tol [Opitutales bacterium]